jgi:hypothetical protein
VKNDPTPTAVSKWEPNRWARVGIRVLRTYLQGALGLLAVTSLGNVIPGNPIPEPSSAGQILYVSFYAALFPALIALLQNAIEELNKLDPGTSLRG